MRPTVSLWLLLSTVEQIFLVNALHVLVKYILHSKTFNLLVFQAHLSLNFRTGTGMETSESIDLNYRENYVMISTPGHQQVQPVVIIHDYTEVSVMRT